MTVAVEKHQVLRIYLCVCVCVCVCARAYVHVSLVISTCNAYAPYCDVICGPSVSTLSLKRRDFRKKKKLLDMQCVFLFSLQILFETILILRRI